MARRLVGDARDRVAVLLAALVGALAGLLVGQVAVARTAEGHVRDFAAELLAHGVDVAATSRAALSEINASGEVPCSDADLLALRQLAFRSDLLRDVGRLDGRAIVCTALWGRLDPPVQLPEPQRVQHEDDMLWAGISGIPDLGMNVDIAGRASAMVVTSPGAFAVYEQRPGRYSSVLLTRDGEHRYREFGDADRLGWPRHDEPWYDVRSRRTASSCDPVIDICVIASIAPGGILSRPAEAAAAGGLGLLVGGSLGGVFVLRRRSRLSLPQQIRRAIAADRLTVVMQPLVRMRDGRQVGAEALARLTDDHGDPISPEVFIRIAEETGLVDEITRVVVHKALAAARPWLLADPDLYVSVNLTAAEIVDADFRAFVVAEVARAGVPPQQVVLEMTERSTADLDLLIEGMAACRAHGFRMFLDDFGTGYSNLAHLAKLPISGIKIDRMFTQTLGLEVVSATIVDDVCTIATTLGIELVVEGVETDEQADRVLHLYADAIGQGWLYGHPTPAPAP